VHSAKALTTASKLASANGSASALPPTTCTRAAACVARRSIRARMPASGSSAVTSVPGAYQRSWAPVPDPISSTRPRACAASRRRQPPTAARSNGHITAS